MIGVALGVIVIGGLEIGSGVLLERHMRLTHQARAKHPRFRSADMCAPSPVVCLFSCGGEKNWFGGCGDRR